MAFNSNFLEHFCKNPSWAISNAKYEPSISRGHHVLPPKILSPRPHSVLSQSITFKNMQSNEERLSIDFEKTGIYLCTYHYVPCSLIKMSNFAMKMSWKKRVKEIFSSRWKNMSNWNETVQLSVTYYFEL